MGLHAARIELHFLQVRVVQGSRDPLPHRRAAPAIETLQTEFGLPKRLGRSSHGMPVFRM